MAFAAWLLLLKGWQWKYIVSHVYRLCRPWWAPLARTVRGKGSNLKSHGGGGARRNDTVAMVTAEADGPATRPETDDAPVSSRWLCPAPSRSEMHHPSVKGRLLAGAVECGPPEGD